MPTKDPKETLNKLIPFMVRQVHSEQNQKLAVRPELVEGLVQSFPKVNDSPLSQIYTDKGKSVEVCIYRLEHIKWTIEIVDEYNNSTVYNEEFESDGKALEAFLSDVKEEGIEAFIGKASATNN